MSVKLRKRKLKSGRTQLYLSIYRSGIRKYEALDMFLTRDSSQNREILRLAEAIRAKRELDVHADAEGISAPWRNKIDFFDFAVEVYENKSPHAKHTFINALEHLKSFAGEHLTFAGINERFCADFRTFLLSRLKRNSAAAYFARFKSILRTAERERYLAKNPSIDVAIHTVPSLPKYLTYEQIQSKTDSPEVLPLSESALAIACRQEGFEERSANPNSLVFPFPRRSSVDKVLKTWAKKAGISVSLSFNKARHSFATLMVTQNVDIYTISKLMGHKNVATTQIYAKVIDKKKREAIDRLPKIGS